MSSGSFGKGEKSETQRVDVPDFLKPLIGQGTAVAGNALGRLSHMLTGPASDFVAGFNPDQLAAFDRIRDVVGGAGGFLPQAQETLLEAARGAGLSFIPESVRQGLSSLGGLDFLPDFTRDTLTSGTSVPTDMIESALGSDAARVLSGISRGGGIPTQATDALGNAINAEVIPGAARDTLATAASGGFSPEQLDTLRQTANGDFLFGGPGSDAAIEAAVRAAQPAILSTFGSAGVGGGTGALSQAAIGQAATDAFARQFAQERQNQLGAAGTLANLGLAGNQQRLGAAESLANLGLSGQAQRIGAADVLGRLGLSGQAQQAGAASNLLGSQIQAGGLLGDLGLSGRAQDLQAAGLLGGFAEGAEGRALQGAGLLADLSDAERARQLTAAGALPDLAFAGLEPLLNIGNLQQQLAQQRLTAPADMQLRLLGAALGIPGSFAPLFGQSGESSSRGFTLGFGD